MQIPKLIGITGPAGSGKDTLADHISNTFGHEKHSFAAPIKELLNKRFGWTMEMWDDRQWKESPAISGVFVHDKLMGLQDPLLSPRQLAQWLGTDVGRELGGADIWLNRLIHLWTTSSIDAMVIPDVRFDNEAEAIGDMGGVIIKLSRPGLTSTEGPHASAKGVQSKFINATITNDRGLGEFLYDAVSVLQTMRRR